MSLPITPSSSSPSYFSGAFWKGMSERAISTFVQAAVGVLIAGGSFSALGADWHTAGSVGFSAAVLAVLKAVLVQFVNEKGSPSIVDESTTG